MIPVVPDQVSLFRGSDANVLSRKDFWGEQVFLRALPAHGIGILANDDSEPIGWKPIPLFPRANQSKSKGATV